MEKKKKERFEDVISVRGTIEKIFKLPNGAAVMWLNPVSKSEYNTTEIEIPLFVWEKLGLEGRLTEEMEVIVKLDSKGEVVNVERILH